MTAQPKVRFAVIGLNHGHIYDQVNMLLEAGAELVSFYTPEEALAASFAKAYPQAKLAGSTAQILEDPSIQLVTSAAIPNERAPLGVEVMRHGKDFLSDKPGFTTLEQLAEARKVQAETGQIYSVFYAERLANPATLRAGELVKTGVIGEVVQTIGVGPHKINLANRPEWFFEREKYGGILTDIASHQMDQFLYFSQAQAPEVVFSQVANYHHPDYPELEDFGDAVLRGENCSGYVRVDWFTPGGLPSFGDTRLTVIGTKGYIEVRKNLDIGGRAGANHLFLIDDKGIHYQNCEGIETPFARQLLDDIRNRTETAMTQEHCFLASELALQAQAKASRLGFLAQPYRNL
ncbi:MAG TPA: Gfo/Idh/MocA family oxidoreductase [Chloroflexia bacterium]|nr:Gfo/Idh/MocA family oxidoreductase [Chloroflexia bacterium]